MLHQLTKAPFEPLKEASLKHLTLKTVFLLALDSGKCRSEIHVWLRTSATSQTGPRCLFTSHPAFCPRTSWPKRIQIVWPRWSFQPCPKIWMSCSPVRALCYYLERTSDLRQELVFVPFKKGFDKDISPATVSSSNQQTVILCYELSDQQALNLHQVKAHDVRTFAASKAFQSGISLEQILSACHWKSHNTFKQFYLKD